MFKLMLPYFSCEGIAPKPKGRKPMYALLHWVVEGSYDVVFLSSIRKSADRVVGKRFKHRIDKKGSKSKKEDNQLAECEIIKISGVYFCMV